MDHFFGLSIAKSLFPFFIVKNKDLIMNIVLQNHEPQCSHSVDSLLKFKSFGQKGCARIIKI